MAFIPIDKMKALREAAKNGDERAKHILDMQLKGEDFSSLLDEHFSPKKEEQKHIVAENTDNVDDKLQKFLEYNGVKPGDDDYQATVDAYYQEFPKAKPQQTETIGKATDGDDIVLPNDDDNSSIYGEEDEPIVDDPNQNDGFLDYLLEDEVEAIDGYNKAIMDVMNRDKMSEAVKKGLISDLEEIRKEEIEHLDKLKRLKQSVQKDF